MENQEKELPKTESMDANSAQELINNVDQIKSVSESQTMDSNGKDRRIENDNSDLQSAHEPKRNLRISEVDLPNDVPNDETPPLNDMPKNYERMNKKAIPNDSTEHK